ncbi:MAG: acetoacetate--CoA ligase [Planctomycetes bacterium]|nr:acetoacetate--CoA ligase [Planctomycetota bacterium]
MATTADDVLWMPSPASIERSAITRFRAAVTERHPRAGADRVALHRWSVEKPGRFWREVWDFCEVDGDPGPVDCLPATVFREWRFFPEGRLNIVENLLWPSRLGDATYAGAPAVIAHDEQGLVATLTRLELWQAVCRLARHLADCGVVPGMRVAAVLPNRVEAVIAMLATAALGGVWSCCSPDFGDAALYDRFGQIEPTVLVSTATTRYAGKSLGLDERLGRLAARLPSLTDWVHVGAAPQALPGVRLADWEEIQTRRLVPITLKRFPFAQPLAILYSSGTTGAPKCIVHGAGGTLLQHLKEHRLHCDIGPGDRLLYYTTTGWMMWNWLVSALASDAAIVLYDGSPLEPHPGILWDVADEEGVTHFGASARYFAAIEQRGFLPGSRHALAALRALLSTGSPLLPDQFRWLYRAVKPDMHLASISGGTDIVSCFVLGDPTLPVRAGEIQCKGLGMDVAVADESGRSVVGVAGELVCRTPFPSMPLGFWNDPEGRAYHHAYFDRYPDIWCHGDWALETASGGMVIYGRSDAVLNPGGVRIGTGEIYRELAAFPEVVEGLATALRRDGDERIVLFLRLAPGATLDAALEAAVRDRLRRQCSPRHVPHLVVAAPDLPRTVSGKLSEIAARNAISDCPVGNAGALANPECLAFFVGWARMVREADGHAVDPPRRL